jgi:DNA helicase HerA-like ATPase
MPIKAICISRSVGASGESVGRAVADRLGFRYLDDEVIAEAAEWSDLDPALVAGAERRQSFVGRLLGQSGTPTRLPAGGEPTRGLPTDADLRTLIRNVLRSFADEGSVVIVAHAASFALVGREVLRVLVTASFETRVDRLAAADGLDRGRAAKSLKASDAARAEYLKRFYGIDRELPTHYDIVVNTDVLSTEQATDVIVSAEGHTEVRSLPH